MTSIFDVKTTLMFQNWKKYQLNFYMATLNSFDLFDLKMSSQNVLKNVTSFLLDYLSILRKLVHVLVYIWSNFTDFISPKKVKMLKRS